MQIVLLTVIVYLYASMPFSVWATRLLAQRRLDQEGTGSISVVAAFKVGGFWAGLVAILGEVSKALLAIGLGRLVLNGDLVPTLVLVIAAFAGSVFPLFHGFRGSHGSTVTTWSLLFLSPLSLGILFALSVAANLLFHNRLKLKRLWILAIVPTLYLVEQSWPLALFGIIPTLVFWFKGREGRDDNRYYFGRTASGSLVAQLGRDTFAKEAGAKTHNLLRMLRMGCRIPTTWVIEPAALRAYRERAEDTLKQLRAELAEKLEPGTAYAIRSSAAVEDTAETSFAGQFATRLNICGLDETITAIQQVWASTESETVRTYREHQGDKNNAVPIDMGVLVQEMVQAELSGVAFSRDPNTGRDQVVVEAVAGIGQALVQDGITPERWVRKWGAWTERPTEQSSHEQLMLEIVKQTRNLAKRTGRELDLEWAWDGKQVYWLQMRDITTSLQALDVFSNRISGEFLPGIIKPLVFSINVPIVNSAWIHWLEQMAGPLKIAPEALAESFYYRAYFNMGALGRIFEVLGLPYDLLEILMGIEGGDEKPGFRPTAATLKHIPRMTLFAIRQLLQPGRHVSRIQELDRAFDLLQRQPLTSLTDENLLRKVDRLYATVSQAAELNVLLPMLNSAYMQWLKNDLLHMGKTLDDVDLTGPYADTLAALDPETALSELADLWKDLPQSERHTLSEHGADALPQLQSETFRKAFDDLMAKHGHHSESGNDFSVAPWREQPDLVLRLIASHTPMNNKKGQPLEDLTHQKGSRPWFGWVSRRASLHSLMREQISSVYTHGYGLFRPFYAEIGTRLASRGQLDTPDDIYCMTASRVHTALLDKTHEPCQHRVASVKEEIERWRDIQLPDIIYGHIPPPVLSRAIPGKTLQGTATSRGYYAGKAAVINSLSEMARMQEGDVLIIPYSDVGWTPLFARAGAIVSERGGILSHSSIIAREYGIPAVVALPNAMQIPNGRRVIVDGYRGIVILEEEASASPAPTMTGSSQRATA